MGHIYSEENILIGEHGERICKRCNPNIGSKTYSPRSKVIRFNRKYMVAYIPSIVSEALALDFGDSLEFEVLDEEMVVIRKHPVNTD